MNKAVLISIVLLSGCHDDMTVTFHKEVDLTHKAESEIKEILKGIAVVNSFDWPKDAGTSNYNQSVNINIQADEDNLNYSLQAVSKQLKDKLSYEKPEIVLSVKITDTEPSALELFSVKNGDVLTSKVEWRFAKAGIFYSKPSKLVGSSSDFYCSIEVPIESKLPIFFYKKEYSANTDDPQLMELLDLMATRELKHQISLDGLPIEPDSYQMNLETGYQPDGYYHNLHLAFKFLGKKSVYNNFGIVSAPDGYSIQDCKEFIRNQTGSNLFGVVGKVSAKNNVTQITAL